MPGKSPSRRRGKALAKPDLPQKQCATCGRPFTWRRKWAAVWQEVKRCSVRCRSNRLRLQKCKPTHPE
ncbi:MAG: DUF2256 domain-containing protein [Hyphomonadaceae bacterium]|nr:DUF2256 domain-containing protein [Hyphomonadaceae bacterium]